MKEKNNGQQSLPAGPFRTKTGLSTNCYECNHDGGWGEWIRRGDIPGLQYCGFLPVLPKEWGQMIEDFFPFFQRPKTLSSLMQWILRAAREDQT